MRCFRLIRIGVVSSFCLTCASIAMAQKAAPSAHRARDQALTVQVMLDRSGFSSGEIDGRIGANTRRAIATFQRAHDLSVTGVPDEATMQALGLRAGAVEPLTPYVLSDDDVNGPFTERIPEELPEQAKLPALNYRSALEALAEKYHSSPALLKALNPRATFTRAGEQILVPNVSPVDPAPAPGVRPPAASLTARGAPPPRALPRSHARSARPQALPAPPPQASPASKPAGTAGTASGLTVTVTRATSALTVRDASGAVVFFAPVTTGSEHDPLPIGRWKVTGVSFDPVFNYNPALFWDANPRHSKAKLPAGPNNPVGRVWIDIDKPHYGLHGTPEPSRIGSRHSHGCVRLTNWDALRLAALVRPGTPVIFE